MSMMVRYIALVGIIFGLLFVAFNFTNCGQFDLLDTAGNSSQLLQISPIDSELQVIISQNKLTPFPNVEEEDEALIILGEALFNETLLSGDKDTSCATCHFNEAGTGDGLPLPIGTGGEGEFPNRKQINGKSEPMPRHAPALFNKGLKGQKFALWDGRIELVSPGVVQTPAPEISGTSPFRPDIPELMETGPGIQPLFPIITPVEFLGFDNEIANLGKENHAAIWDKVLNERVLSQSNYQLFFRNAFPNTPLDEIHPGHIARAIKAFFKTQFLANDTPFDRYLNGDLTAMNEQQKQGMKVFYGVGQCQFCHTGTMFTRESFENIATPFLGFKPFINDTGREQVTNNDSDKYKFKVPGLRNVKLSAPYMHNGAFETLRDVIEFKNNIREGNLNYEIPQSFRKHYELELITDKNAARMEDKLSRVPLNIYKEGLNLTQEQKDDLLEFLENGLLDETFLSR